MSRWLCKRWAWAVVVGATVTVGGATGADAPQKVGSVISLNIDGKGERQFKVLKCEKQSDGSYQSELKDTKTGETITLVDQPETAPSKGAEPSKTPVSEPSKGTEPPKGTDSGAPKAKPRPTDAMPDVAKDKDKEKDKEKEKRPLLRMFEKDKPSDSAGETKKPGMLARVFGKKPSGPNMAAPVTGPAVKTSSSTPPPVLPVPSGGLAGGSTAEPPRVMPTKPVTVPTVPPVQTVPVPAPVPAPTTTPTPIPTPLPGLPTPMPTTPAPVPIPQPLPSLPPAGGGLPPIPVPPSGTSSTKPIQIVVPAGYVPPQVAFDREVEPFVIALQSMESPSGRLTAAKGLAEGRHSSTEGVKTVLFKAAQMDPCGEVRAACITHLCNLGYFNGNFLGHIQTACVDTDPMVREAAKAACAKMIRK